MAVAPFKMNLQVAVVLKLINLAIRLQLVKMAGLFILINQNFFRLVKTHGFHIVTSTMKVLMEAIGHYTLKWVKTGSTFIGRMVQKI